MGAFPQGALGEPESSLSRRGRSACSILLLTKHFVDG